MEKQHLTYFKIENFKRFDSFEMSNLGQFNLIVGDNNVGKTSVLEALCFDEEIVRLALNYFNVANFRNTYTFEKYPLYYHDVQQTNFWTSIFKDILKPIIIEVQGVDLSKMIIEYKSKKALNDEQIDVLKNSIVQIEPEKYLVLSNYYTNAEPVGEILPAYLKGLY